MQRIVMIKVTPDDVVDVNSVGTELIITINGGSAEEVNVILPQNLMGSIIEEATDTAAFGKMKPVRVVHP